MDLASNGFASGLIMDYDAMSTPNNALTSALNATLVTYNGNEYILQNDMGNGRVETAYLPEGFIPIGTTAFGGIIYIASYNPITGVGQIGSFPSPERNFGMEKEDDLEPLIIKDSICSNNGIYYTTINIPLSEKIELTPGDKFIICFSDESLSKMFGYVDGILKDDMLTTDITCAELAIGILLDGKTRELGSLRRYKRTHNSNEYTSIFAGMANNINENNIDIDDYRSIVSSPYSVVTGLYSGTLCLIIKLKIIDSFSVGYTAKLVVDD